LANCINPHLPSFLFKKREVKLPSPPASPLRGRGKKEGVNGGGKMLEEYIPQLKELEKKVDELRGYL